MNNPNPQDAPEDAPFEAQTPPPPSAEAAAAALADRVNTLEALIETLKNERLMALAEAENAGKRADKRIADNAKYAVSNICKALVTVADNLGRALLAAPVEARAANDTLKNLATGVEMTEKELITVLENQGVRRVESLNQPFDANFHNAIQEVENIGVPSGTVVQVFQEGYVMHDRLLRPAWVVVSNGGPKRDAAPARPTGGNQTV